MPLALVNIIPTLKNGGNYLLVIIFFPLTKVVEVDVLLTAPPPPPPLPFDMELKDENDVNPLLGASALKK